MEWGIRRSFLVWLLSPIFVAGLLLLALSFANPQSSRFVYIFQSVFSIHEGQNPWGFDGPKPPENYTGVWYRWYWNGKLSFEEHYVNGKLDGPFRVWYKSGRRWEESSYRAGRLHGDYVLFYENGLTNKLWHYFEGKPIGRWFHFYRNGKKWEERFFSAPGVPDGESIAWDTNGAVEFSHTWRKGEPWEGRFIFDRGTNYYRDVYESGKLISTTNLGPIPPWAYLPVPSQADSLKK